MGFFDRPPPGPPEDHDSDDAQTADSQTVWIGGVIPEQVLLARTEAAAVTIRNLTVFPDGFGFDVSAYVRRRSAASRRRDHHGIGLAFHPTFDEDGELDPCVLRFGLEFSDGTRVTTLDERGPVPRSFGQTHGLRGGGGGGGNRAFTARYWAWPVPSGGPLTFVCEWPEYDITESRAVVDDRLFSDALRAAHPIWPDWNSGLHIHGWDSGVLGEQPPGE